MSLFIDTTYRSQEVELMDDFNMEGALLRDTLDQLGKINKWLGGNRITLNGLKELLKQRPEKQTYTIIDLGCGHGDMLRQIADFGREKRLQFQLIGIDANKDAIAYANELSLNYPEISYESIDIFSSGFRNMKCDIALCTLFLHHFSETDIIALLNQLQSQTSLGIVVNDLQRSEIAYGLFRLLGMTISNPMVKQDGLTSILRAFKRQDLMAYSKQLDLPYQLHWRWAFRYQWILNTNNQQT